MSSTELVTKTQTGELTLNVTDQGNLDIVSLAKALCASGYFKDVASVSQGIVKILVGRELGITDMASVMNIHIIKGKPTLAAHLIAAQIKKSGIYKYAISELTREKCVIKWWSRERTRDGFTQWEPLTDSEFTIADAKASRVSFDADSSWSKTPRNMLMWRALTLGQRMHCPEVTIGSVYTPEELGEIVDENGGRVISIAATADAPTSTANGRPSAIERLKASAPQEPAQDAPVEESLI